MKKMLIIFSCLTLISVMVFSGSKKQDLLPKKMKIISQSSDMDQVYITVIDLENNEVVILVYSGGAGLNNVFRTGIFADPNTQLSFSGKDSPMKPQS